MGSDMRKMDCLNWRNCFNFVLAGIMFLNQLCIQKYLVVATVVATARNLQNVLAVKYK